MPTFLNPALLWGLSLAAIPIVIHLLNRRRYRRLKWAAMDFLLAALKKNQRRLRLENLLVLLVRTLILLLLALAISRPFFADSAALAAIQRERTSLVLVVDNSYSMGLKEGLSTPFERAVEQAATLVGSLNREDTVSIVVTADNVLKHDLRPRAVQQESADHDKARSLLGRLRVSPLPASIGRALEAAEEVLAQPAESRRLVLLTDLQAAFWETGTTDESGIETTARDLLERLGDRGVDVAVLDCGSSEARNASVSAIRPEFRQRAVAGTDTNWLVDVQNHGPVENQVELTLRVDGRKVASRTVVLPPWDSEGKAGKATALFSLPFSTPGDHAIVAEITTDALPIDDSRTAVIRVRERIRVLAVDGDPNPRNGGKSETWLLENMLEASPWRSGPIQVDVVDVLALGGTDLDTYDLVVLANVDRLRDDVVERIERYVDAGRTLVLFLGDRVDPEMMNQALLATDDGLLPARLGSSQLRPRDDPVSLRLVASDHPMLKELMDARNNDWFFPPPVFGFVRVEPVVSPTVRVLATYDDLDRSPAIVERRRGDGRVLLFTTAADDDWADLGPSFLFISLLHDMVHDVTWVDPIRWNLSVGQPLEVPLAEGVESVTVAPPRGGTPLRLDPIESEDETIRAVLRDTEEPGLYVLSFRGPGGDPLDTEENRATRALFAFQLDPAEGAVRRLSAEALRGRLRGLDVLVTRDADRILARPTEARQGEIWKFLLLVVLLLLGLESFLARRFGDYARREGR